MQESIRFGTVEVRAGERRMLVDGVAAQLGGRAFDLLLALIERRDRVVSKDELIRLCWPGLVVEESNLAVQVGMLRKLLGPQAIATVAGRGYRFALSVDAGDAKERTANDGATDGSSPAAATASIAEWIAPSGPVTYVFTDVEGSSRLWEEHPQAMQPLMAQHDALCKALVAQHGGHIVKFTGDGIHAVFSEPSCALQTAIALQLAVGAITTEPQLALRIGLHRGADAFRDGDFFGTAVNRAARIMSAAHGGQVLVSGDVVRALGQAMPAPLAMRDLGAVRLRDLTGAEHLYQALHPALRAEFPPLRSLQATPNNLPQQVNAFIGRQQEQLDVADLMAQGRLVTLVAMGGIGKSRLAVQVGASLLDQFADGVWLVELAPITDAQAVPLAVASALGLRETAGTLTDALMHHLRDRQLLIVLDNCEHLVGACAQLTKTLLQGTSGVKVLATSRDPLKVAGETTYPLRPLGAPATGTHAQPPRPQELLRHEAVQLFVERAQAAQAGFRLDANNAAAVAEICGRLDGIPLALELAAARVRAMTPQTIAGRLDRRFKLLVAGDRTVLPRQQTLQALIEWSYDLLPPEEALLFRRLSIFAAGWTLDLAEEVCGFGTLAPDGVLFLLANLVQKSLAMLDTDTGRYRMLETVRAFASERLAGQDDAQQLRELHFAAYVKLAEEASSNLFGPEQRKWLERLDVEGENILAAHSSNCEHGRTAEPALALGAAMRGYFIERGLLNVGIKMLLDALALPGVESLGLPRIRALWSVADLMRRAGDYRQAAAHFTQCHALVQPLNDPRRSSVVLGSLCMSAAGFGDLAAARSYGEQAVVAAEQSGAGHMIASAQVNLGLVLHAEGDHRGAGRLYRQALRHLRTAQDEIGVAAALLNVALLRLRQGRPQSAETLLRAALQRVVDLQSSPLMAASFDCAAVLCVSLGDWERAAGLFATAEARLSLSGQRREPLDQLLLADALEAVRSRGYVMRPREAMNDETAELQALHAWLAQRHDAAHDRTGTAAALN